MKILFLHGWQSIPDGVKPTYLKDRGHEVLNPALPDDDFDAAVRIAQAEFDRHRPDLVVGSSHGGAVAMNIKAGSAPLVLLRPVWKYWGTARTVKPGTIILHSKADDVVPFSDSVELLQNSGLSSESLVAVGAEHRLTDPASLRAMLEACGRAGAPEFLAHVQEARRARFRFGIGTLLAITALYAVLFGILRALGTSAITFVTVVMFFTVVGLGQKFLFRGQRRRLASTILGACFCVGLSIFLLVRFVHTNFGSNASLIGAALFGGASIGYFTGLLITGVFWILDKLTNFFIKTESPSRP
jgi:hypothetical protein